MFFFKKSKCKDLYSRETQIHVGRNTFINPNVIIDSPSLIKIGSNTIIRAGVVLRPESGELVIGNNCVINHYSVLHGKGGIYIGDWTVIGPHCGFYAQNHTFESFDMPITKQENIGKGIYLMGDNWIGAHAVILDDVTIGKGSIIGANSTLTRSMPMASIAAGSPATIKRKRYSGPWDFNKAESASSEGMPVNIQDHVKKRGELIKELIDPNDIVLDIGCGEGIVTSILWSRCSNTRGCDYSSESIERARKRNPTIEFVASNSTNLKFTNSTFTKVVLSDVAEHLLKTQLIKTLQEINRVLTKEGTLILTTPLTGNGVNTTTYAHIYEYSKREIKAILSKLFSNVRLIDEDFGVFVAKKMAT
ncbi:putative acetyltransferase [bacterium BMS3Bbin08]|nr:putative acetyltransferase [bacterium BMS3Bbin08]